MGRASWLNVRTVVTGLGVTLLLLAVALLAVLSTDPSDDGQLPPSAGDAQQVLGTAAAGGAPPGVSSTPTAAPTATVTTTSPAPAPPPSSSSPARDQAAPSIGDAVTENLGIWTDYWCSAGPTRSQIQIPVQDPTDATNQLQVTVHFVLRRGDTQGTVDMGTVAVSAASSPFVVDFGPYPGPDADYAYDNVIDMNVTATDPAGNSATRTFASFMTFNDCKAGA